MTKIITIANQKGGVAKTTTSSALAAGLFNRGYRVLAIDLDAQGNLSDSADVDEELPTVYELMKGIASVNDVIQKTNSFDIIPANLALASADMEFVSTGREFRLSKAIQPIKDQYDFIIVDTPPTLGIMTVNAFILSDEVIVPASGFDGVKGIMNLWSTIDTVRDFGNKNLKVSGILLTMYNPRTIIDQDLRDLAIHIGKQINAPVFDTYIRKSVIVNEAKSNKMDIYSYSESNNVSIDYNNLVDEYLRGDIKNE